MGKASKFIFSENDNWELLKNFNNYSIIKDQMIRSHKKKKIH